jgi:hypothetical protein
MRSQSQHSGPRRDGSARLMERGPQEAESGSKTESLWVWQSVWSGSDIIGVPIGVPQALPRCQGTTWTFKTSQPRPKVGYEPAVPWERLWLSTRARESPSARSVQEAPARHSGRRLHRVGCHRRDRRSTARLGCSPERSLRGRTCECLQWLDPSGRDGVRDPCWSARCMVSDLYHHFLGPGKAALSALRLCQSTHRGLLHRLSAALRLAKPAGWSGGRRFPPEGTLT